MIHQILPFHVVSRGVKCRRKLNNGPSCAYVLIIKSTFAQRLLSRTDANEHRHQILQFKDNVLNGK